MQSTTSLALWHPDNLLGLVTNTDNNPMWI